MRNAGTRNVFVSGQSTGWERESIGHVDPGNSRIR